MSTRLTAAVLTVLFATSTFSHAGDPSDRFEAVVADVIIARPLWLVATVVGAGFFVASLPISATSGSVRRTGRTLVGKPAQATFTRPLGDFSHIE
jgi:hypothetical protein